MLRKYFMVLVVGLMMNNAINAQIDTKKIQQNAIVINDSNYIKSLVLLSVKFSFTKPDSAIFYANKSITIAAKTANAKYIIESYNALGSANYVKGNYQASILNFKDYYQAAKKVNDYDKMAYALTNEGNVYIELSDYQTVLNRYQQALTINQTFNNASGIALIYYNIGFVYKDLGDYEKAITNLLFSLREYEKLKKNKPIANIYNVLAVIYLQQKRYDIATNYNEKALTIQKSNNDITGLGISLSNLATIYTLQLQYNKAIDYYNEAIKYYNSRNDTRQLAIVYTNLGELCNIKNDFKKAIPFFEKSIEASHSIGNRRNITNAFIGLASAYIGNGNASSAKIFIDSADAVIAKSKNKIDIKNFYDVLASYNEAVGNFKGAYEAHKKYAAAKDTLLNIENSKSILELQTKYETEKKDFQINIFNKTDSIKSLQITNQQLAINTNLYQISKQKLALADADLALVNDNFLLATKNSIILKNQLDSTRKEENINSLNKQAKIQNLELNNQKLEVTRKNIIITVIVVLAVMGLLLGYSFYRRYKLQQQTKLQQEILKQQDLATKAIIAAEETERKRIATDLHDGVGQLMSAAKMNLSAIESDLNFTSVAQKNAYDKAMALVDEGCKEVRAVSHNMMPNALLRAGLASAVREFLDNLNSQVIKINLYADGLNERIDSNTETILYRVIQECVNNVIKHAKASLLDISIIKEAENISVTIEDNGVGFDKNSLKNGTGIGLKNIETRMAFLKGSVEWESQPGKGTLVVLHVVC